MSNTIRTPKVGVTANSRKIALAVDDEKWQEFRVSMKGKSTQVKLDMLKGYYENEQHTHGDPSSVWSDACVVCIRLDNYIKALCRGGLLYGGESLVTCVEAKWKLRIKKK